MSTPKLIDRKAFLTSTLTWAAVTLSGCGSSGDGGGTGGGTGMNTGGSGGATGGASGSGGSGSGGHGDAGTGGMGTGGMRDAGLDAMDGASADSTGGTFMCMSTVEVTNNHTHPLTIPPSDVERGSQAAPYVLQNGGTGHTHMLELTAYDFVYLQAGSMIMRESSTDNNHSHQCDLLCTMG